jgi:hypothetical protein
MFVSKEKFRHLCDKVQSIEEAVSHLQVDTQVWDTSRLPPSPLLMSGGAWYQDPRDKAIRLNNFRGNDHILLVDIVTELLDKLGYEVRRSQSLKVKEKILCKK